MVIASIDVQNGKVVQLRGGAELVLQKDNAPALAEEFDRYGEVAVIDLDAAKGTGGNAEMIKPLLRKAECRVGGGVRTAEDAKEWVSLGARKVIVGSSAFRLPDGGFGVNTAFLESMERAIGRERLVVAVDARDGVVVVDGWKTPTGLSLTRAAREAAPFAGELLFTCVEREGTMTGIDLSHVAALRRELRSGGLPQTRLTVAGGVSTLTECESLAALDCDVQLGMALYTGRLGLAEAFTACLNWRKAESLIPVIAQSEDGQVLMTGFADREAFAETFRRGKLCFYSRTRGRLWMKGERSGNTLDLVRLRADCDRDAVLAVVRPAGPVCHTGGWSCFALNRRYTLEYLQSVLKSRFRNSPDGSYTATLDDERVRAKLREECGELCEAKSREEVVWEAADVLYFVTALLTRAEVSLQDVLDELERRSVDRRHKSRDTGIL